MTDKELLELAARAAGYVDSDDLAMPEYLNVYDAHGVHALFNPLTNDGDAFRLAVALNLNVFSVSGTAYAMPSEDDGTNEQRVDHNGDPYAATRRAITRAAAAIGKERGE